VTSQSPQEILEETRNRVIATALRMYMNGEDVVGFLNEQRAQLDTIDQLLQEGRTYAEIADALEARYG